MQRPKNRRPSGLLLAGLAVALIAAGCGGGGGKRTPTAQQTTTTARDSTASSAVPTTEASAPQVGVTATTAVTNTTAAPIRSTGTTTKKAVVPAGATKAVTKAPAGGIANVTAAPTTAASAAIQPGGTFTYLKTADITGFDPVVILNSGSSDGLMGDLVFDMLVYSDPVDGQVKPQTAESLTSADGTVWTLKIKPNIAFTDGSPYDAAAVKFNYLRLQDPANKATRATQANVIKSMDVIDAVTLRLTLVSKDAVFPQIVALIPFIGSPKAIQQQGAGFTNNPVGAGPFMLKSWVRDSQMVFVRNPRYWDAPRPYVDQVVSKIVADESQRINTFATEGDSLMFIATPQNADQASKKGGVSVPIILNGGLNIYFNTRVSPFSDARARQAIAMGIDRVDYAKVLYGGLIEPLDSIFRHDSPFYDPSITEPPYDPVKAQQLFDQLAADTGKPLDFTLTTFTATNYATAAQYVQGVLNKYRNVKVTVVQEAGAVHNTNCLTGNFAAACVHGPIFDDPEPIWTAAYTCNANPSVSGWCDPNFDALVTDQRETLDPNKRISDIKQLQKIFYAAVPALHLERRYSYMVVSPGVQDFSYVNDGLPRIDHMWFKTR